jgi:hypothetical protein
MKQSNNKQAMPSSLAKLTSLKANMQQGRKANMQQQKHRRLAQGKGPKGKTALQFKTQKEALAAGHTQAEIDAYMKAMNTPAQSGKANLKQGKATTAFKASAFKARANQGTASLKQGKGEPMKSALSAKGPAPTPQPTPWPTPWPTAYPTLYPTQYPTLYPTKYPTLYPTDSPTEFPTKSPTQEPTAPTFAPTAWYPPPPLHAIGSAGNPPQTICIATSVPTTTPTKAPTKSPAFGNYFGKKCSNECSEDRVLTLARSNNCPTDDSLPACNSCDVSCGSYCAAQGECDTASPVGNCAGSTHDIYLINCIQNSGTPQESLMFEKQGMKGTGWAGMHSNMQGTRNKANTAQMMAVTTEGTGDGSVTRIVMASGMMCVVGLMVLVTMISARRRNGYANIESSEFTGI